MNEILKKMRINAPHVLCGYNAPADFSKIIGKLPDGIKWGSDQNKCDSLHWFVKDKAAVDTQTQRVIKLLKPGMTVWCYYPKGSSKIQTDLTRDKGWDTLLKEQGLRWISLISIDDTWSAFAFRFMTEKDKVIAAKPKEREIFKYVDPKAKTVTLPQDLAAAFKKNKSAQKIFDALSFTNRKEYIEWIITAKREETRMARVETTLEKLLQGMKNPAQK